MSLKGIIWTGLAIFVGVFGALQADHFLRIRETAQNRPQAVGILPDPLAEVRPVALDTTQDGPLDFRVAAKKVIPSVVSVDRYEQGVNFFGDPTGQVRETGTGSGVIVSSEGLVVTNNHVVADENGTAVPEVKVRLNDHRTMRAKVIGTDPRADIAVLKISGSGLTPMELGTSSNLEIGQWVMAVGNPLGFDDTVSVGVVSSLKRDLPKVGASGLVNAIQTDAAINPGNSGGALTDQHGRLVGINAAIASSTGGSVGIGFAIPVDRVRAVVNDIVKFGHARYASLGIAFPRNADGALGDDRVRDYLSQQTGASVGSVPTAGMIVWNASGAALSAGIKHFDVLLAIDDTPVDSYFTINRLLIQKKPGDHATLKWWSKGQTKTAEVTLMESGGPTE